MLTIPEQQTFGVDAKTCRFTGRPLEQGHGALHPDEQAIGHLGCMEYELAALLNDERKAAAAPELAAEIAAVREKLTKAGVIAAYGYRAASSWRGMILSKGWRIPTP